MVLKSRSGRSDFVLLEPDTWAGPCDLEGAPSTSFDLARVDLGQPQALEGAQSVSWVSSTAQFLRVSWLLAAGTLSSAGWVEGRSPRRVGVLKEERRGSFAGGSPAPARCSARPRGGAGS